MTGVVERPAVDQIVEVVVLGQDQRVRVAEAAEEMVDQRLPRSSARRIAVLGRAVRRSGPRRVDPFGVGTPVEGLDPGCLPAARRAAASRPSGLVVM